jgi:hypothetical protein
MWDAWAAYDSVAVGYLHRDPGYIPANPPMLVFQGGTNALNPNRWQPLALEVQVAHNGVVLPDKVQSFVGAFANKLRPFALERELGSDPWIFAGAPP